MNIVLVHGILGFSHLDLPLLPLDYFAGIAEFLRGRFQAAVVAPALDPTAGIEARAGQLRKSIQTALSTGQLRTTEPLNIIAHSMGGLDSRLMISKDPAIEVNGEKVAIQTLVTIGTPHRGSPVADLVALKFLDTIPLLSGVLKDSGVALAKLLAHFRISLDGLHDLTSESAERFNATTPDQPSVRYLSIAGGGRPGPIPTSRFFLPYYEFLKLHSKGRELSDGVVTVSSAQWGTFDQNLWPGDHADEIGHNLDLPLGPPDPDTLRRYEQIVQRF
jgi:triacylglycerol lipase